MRHKSPAGERRVLEALASVQIRHAQRRRRGPEREARFDSAMWTSVLERHHRTELVSTSSK